VRTAAIAPLGHGDPTGAVEVGEGGRDLEPGEAAVPVEGVGVLATGVDVRAAHLGPDVEVDGDLLAAAGAEVSPAGGVRPRHRWGRVAGVLVEVAVGAGRHPQDALRGAAVGVVEDHPGAGLLHADEEGEPVLVRGYVAAPLGGRVLLPQHLAGPRGADGRHDLGPGELGRRGEAVDLVDDADAGRVGPHPTAGVVTLPGSPLAEPGGDALAGGDGELGDLLGVDVAGDVLGPAERAAGGADGRGLALPRSGRRGRRRD